MAQKASAPKKTTSKRVSKGDSVECEVCGLAVTVEEIGDIEVSEETTLICCGKPMKARKAPKKAIATKPAKAAKSISGWPREQAAGSSTVPADPKEDVEQQ